MENNEKVKIKVDYTLDEIKNLKDEFDRFVSSCPENRKDWSFDLNTEYSRLSSTLTGLKNFKRDMVAEYNAKAKMLTRKFFMGKDIPDHID